MKDITRTIPTSIIHGSSISRIDGQIVEKILEPVQWIGERLKEDQAIRILKKIHGKQEHIIVNKIEITEDLYKLTFEVFIAQAVKIEKRDLPQNHERA